jgi:DNA-binding LacI/PurR family transcriptional regulator
LTNRVTLQSIADALGVSRMTVSNAFSRPEKLSAELRDRILQTADELGYAGPDPAGRMLSTGRSRTIGVLFTDRLRFAFEDPIAGRFLAGIASVVEPADYAITVLSSPRHRGGPVGSVSSAVVDGLIVYSVDTDSQGLGEARRRRMPMVFVDQEPEEGIPSILIDDHGGALAAARHVAHLGHRRVALVFDGLGAQTVMIPDDQVPEPPHRVLRERLRGWREGLAEADVRPSLISIGQHDWAEGLRAGRLLAEQAVDQRPTAVLCLSDEVAAGVMSALAESGLTVPDDVSVIGFDDGPVASMVRPMLTTVRQPVSGKGSLAARLLLERIDGQHDVPADHIVLPTELLVRGSTAPPRHHGGASSPTDQIDRKERA